MYIPKLVSGPRGRLHFNPCLTTRHSGKRLGEGLAVAQTKLQMRLSLEVFHGRI